ncbi:MAG: outer membrane protein assembly factor, partial [Mesorhizobium sp.]
MLSRALVGGLLCATGLVAVNRPAAAFELFGIKLWESASDKEDAEIVDPLRYAVTIEAPDADSDLKDRLESASTLKADEDRPVSGSLGLLTNARAEREQLVAALYQDARYEGVVTVAIQGRSIDDLPPDAEFTGAQPIPVTVTVQAGPKFTLGDIRL